jgi:hypothetical protein
VQELLKTAAVDRRAGCQQQTLPKPAPMVRCGRATTPHRCAGQYLEDIPKRNPGPITGPCQAYCLLPGLIGKQHRPGLLTVWVHLHQHDGLTAGQDTAGQGRGQQAHAHAQHATAQIR